MPFPTASLSEIISLWPDVDNECIGSTKKNCRCKNKTSVASRTRASRLLREGTRRLQSGDEEIDDILGELSRLALCKHPHQGQAPSVAQVWSRKVETYMESRHDNLSSSSSSGAPHSTSRSRISSTARVRRETQTPLSYSLYVDSQPSSPLRSSQADEIIEALRNILAKVELLQTEREGYSSISSTFQSFQSINGHSRSSLPIGARNEHTSGSRIASENQRRTAPTMTNSSPQPSREGVNRHRSVPAPRPTLSRMASSPTATGQSPSRHHERRYQSPAPETPSLPATLSAPTGQRQVTRRPIEGNCHICFLPLQAGNDSEGEESNEAESSDITSHESVVDLFDEESLVWCQRQCGNNFHKNCMNLWARSCERRENPVNCPMCRSEWAMQ